MIATLSPLRLMLYTAVVLAVLAMAWFVSQVGSVLVIVVLGVILSAAIEPLVYRLRRHGFTRGQGILAVYAALLLLMGLAFYLIFPPVLRQGGSLIENIPNILNTLEDQTESSDSRFINDTGTALVRRLQQFYRDFNEAPPIAGATAVQLVSSTVGLLFTVITTLIVGFYWMTEKATIKRLLLGLLAPRHRDRVHGIWDNVEAKLGGWTRGQAILCLAIGSASAVAYSPLVFDLPFWLALALWAGITELIPFIGPWLGGSVAAAIALTQSFETAILVVVFVIVLQQVEGAWLVPKVMKNAVGLTPLTVVIAVQVGGALGGAVGAILAIPIAGAFQVVIQDLLSGRRETIEFGRRRTPATLEQLTLMRTRLGAVPPARPPAEDAPDRAPDGEARQGDARVAGEDATGRSGAGSTRRARPAAERIASRAGRGDRPHRPSRGVVRRPQGSPAD